MFFFSFCNSQPGRVLPNYIYNERDPSIRNFGGRMIDWFNWNEYFPGFICRCAEKAKLAGYDLIGAQFFGKKENVTKCYPRPPPKRNKFIPFLIKNFILRANTYLMTGHTETVWKFCYRKEQVVLIGYVAHVYKFMNGKSQWAVNIRAVTLWRPQLILKWAHSETLLAENTFIIRSHLTRA